MFDCVRSSRAKDKLNCFNHCGSFSWRRQVVCNNSKQKGYQDRLYHAFAANVTITCVHLLFPICSYMLYVLLGSYEFFLKKDSDFLNCLINLAVKIFH